MCVRVCVSGCVRCVCVSESVLSGKPKPVGAKVLEECVKV